MKKARIAVWLVVLALSVTACQAQQSDSGKNDKSDKYDKYEELIEAIEAGNAQLAQAELDEFFETKTSEEGLKTEGSQAETGAGTQASQEKESQVEVEREEQTEPKEEGQAELVAELKVAAVSEWLPSKDSRCEELGSVTIDAGGSCVIGDETLQWEVAEVTENAGYIRMYSEEKLRYELYIYKEEGGYHASYLYKFAEDGVEKEYISGSFYRASDLEKTVITMDNWEEYFIYDTKIIVSENVFGEPDDAYIYKYIKLNPETFPKVVEQISNVAYEFKRLEGYAEGTFDIATQEYAFEFNSVNEHTRMENMHFYDSEDMGFYGGQLESCWITELPYDQSAFWEEYQEMLRIEGVIYSVK